MSPLGNDPFRVHYYKGTAWYSGCVCNPIPNTMYWTGRELRMTGARSFGPDGPRQTVIPRLLTLGHSHFLLTLSPDQTQGRLGHGLIKSLRLIRSLVFFTPSKKREKKSKQVTIVEKDSRHSTRARRQNKKACIRILKGRSELSMQLFPN